MRSLSRNTEPSPNTPIVVPVVPVRGLIAPDIDRRLSNLARTGDHSTAELRNALFTAYAPRLHRILLRLWYRNLHQFGCDFADLEQETFLIFVTLLERWSGNGSFSAYVHGAFPWRLFDAARRLTSRDRSLPDGGALSLVDDDSYAAQEAAVLLEELAESLAPFDRALLLRHVRDGESLTAIARSLGLSARTVRRAWVRLQQHLRRQLTIP